MLCSADHLVVLVGDGNIHYGVMGQLASSPELLHVLYHIALYCSHHSEDHATTPGHALHRAFAGVHFSEAVDGELHVLCPYSLSTEIDKRTLTCAKVLLQRALDRTQARLARHGGVCLSVCYPFAFQDQTP